MKQLKVIICGLEQYKDKQGIHLNNPDTWYLEHAIEDAEKDMFSTIFCHYGSISGKYLISSDVMAILFKDSSLKVKVIDQRNVSNLDSLVKF